jgi:hypothetical protein
MPAGALLDQTDDERKVVDCRRRCGRAASHLAIADLECDVEQDVASP